MSHEHRWTNPPIDFRDRASISFALVGMVCKCGATREYLGPAFGHRVTEPPTSNVERSVPDAKSAIDGGQ